MIKIERQKSKIHQKSKISECAQKSVAFLTFERAQKRKAFLTCPICEKGILKKGKIKESMFGIYLGEFPAEICNKCGESFTDSKTMRKIEEIAKKKGIWGLAKKTKITKTGNSLAVRIPKDIVNFLDLKDGEEAYIHPEDHKLIIETV